MSSSINNNLQAQLALSILNTTISDLQATQERVVSGQKVNKPSDNSAIYSEAQRLRADTDSYSAVTDSLNRASSIINVATTAGTSISNILNQIKTKIVAGADPSNDSTAHQAYNRDFQALMAQLTRTVQSATFAGANLLDGTVPTAGLRFIADAAASNFLTVSPQNLNLGGGIVTLTGASDILTVTHANALLAVIDSSISNVNGALSSLGSSGTAINDRLKFIGDLTTSLKQGISNLVDADIAAESARLQALQVKQQLGVQMLSIANSQPQILLSLFK